MFLGAKDGFTCALQDLREVVFLWLIMHDGVYTFSCSWGGFCFLVRAWNGEVRSSSKALVILLIGTLMSSLLFFMGGGTATDPFLSWMMGYTGLMLSGSYGICGCCFKLF